MRTYHGISIHDDECESLLDLEKKIGKPIPFFPNAAHWIYFGFTIHGKHVTRLGLFNQQLNTLTGSFYRLTKLIDLNLRMNTLKVLPESFGDLTTLRRLDLCSNELTRLPESLGNLSSLKSLSLAGNNLTALPESIGRLKQLKGLELYANELTSLPKTLLNMKSLKYLSIDEKLEDDPVSVELYFRKVQIETDPYDWDYLK